MNAYTCPVHGDKYWDESVLTTGTYEYCNRCADDQIGANDQSIRQELTAKGHPAYKNRLQE